MFIDCYYLSNIVRQPNHIYYTNYDYMFGEFFYFDLNLCNLDNIRFNTYPYKVRIDSNDVYYIVNNGLRALKFQIVEEVNILDWIKASSLKDRIKSYLKSICTGSVSQDKILEFYNKTIIIPTALLTTAQIFKLHAILSQKKYELPTRVITNGNKSYLRAYEFYGREYEFDSNHKPFFKVFEAEAALGSKRFEYIENEDCEILMYDMTSFLKLVATRKLTQNQFEYCCMYSPFLTTADKKKFVNTALRANYDIPHEGRHLFFPEIIFKHESWVTELKTKHLQSAYEKDRLLLIGYKIKDCNYTSYWSSEIKKARAIFKNENYQYIDLETE